VSRCEFAPQARPDLLQIRDHIAQDSPPNALGFVDLLERQCYRLADYPSMGRARPEFGPDHRSFNVPGTRYAIIYRPSADGVDHPPTPAPGLMPASPDRKPSFLSLRP
jgi:toxin ParE1/3/4